MTRWQPAVLAHAASASPRLNCAVSPARLNCAVSPAPAYGMHGSRPGKVCGESGPELRHVIRTKGKPREGLNLTTNAKASEWRGLTDNLTWPLTCNPQANGAMTVQFPGHPRADPCGCPARAGRGPAQVLGRCHRRDDGSAPIWCVPSSPQYPATSPSAPTLAAPARPGPYTARRFPTPANSTTPAPLTTRPRSSRTSGYKARCSLTAARQTRHGPHAH